MKKLIIRLALIASLASATEATGISPYSFYKKLVKKQKIGVVREYYTDKLTGDILRNRGDDIIVERIIGKVIDNKGNGKVLGVEDYDYISYNGVKGIRKGDTVMTVCIYAPNSNGEDDIIERFDYIIDRKGKKVKNAKNK